MLTVLHFLVKPMNRFHDIPTAPIHGYLIFLDIDGTLCADGQTALSTATLKTVRVLKKHNTIVLVSNKKNHTRNALVAQKLGVTYLKTSLRKPDPRILRNLKPMPKKPRLVIGDLFWTDGRFAQKIGARFTKVKTITAPTDSWWIKWAHRADDFLSFILTA